jgi:hypothetical protein
MRKPARVKPKRTRRNHSLLSDLHDALELLEIGDTYELPECPFKAPPAEFARNHCDRTSHKLRALTTSRGTMFVRVE